MVPVWANPPGQITCHGVVVQSPQIKKIITVSWTGQRGNNRYSACRLAQPISFLSCTTPQLANWMMYNTICTSKTSRYDASEADTPVRVMAQRQRLHLTRGSNRSWVSTATVDMQAALPSSANASCRVVATCPSCSWDVRTRPKGYSA